MATIAAIATPPGSGGIAVIRVSGPEARAILESVFHPAGKNFTSFRPWTLHRGSFIDREGKLLDDGLAVFMPGPSTFTGEDVAELHCHGGQLLSETILEAILQLGARPAERGEFTKRAFLNGRIDLTRAEAVAEVIAARSPVALRYGLANLAGHLALRVEALKSQLDELRALACIGLDFPDDEIESPGLEIFAEKLDPVLKNLKNLLSHAERARIFSNSSHIVLAGPVNAGKSSLLNALAGRMRALVSEFPGTTRDYLEVELQFNGLPVCLIDTAGIRKPEEAHDSVEKAGIAKSLELLRSADLVWLVLDGSSQENPADFLAFVEKEAPGVPVLLVWNKSDLAKAAEIPEQMQCSVSALNGDNLGALIEASCEILKNNAYPEDGGVAPNTRQAILLAEAEVELRGFEADLEAGLPHDLCVNRLDMASGKLDEILGLATHDELLDKIFSRFCIGK